MMFFKEKGVEYFAKKYQIKNFKIIKLFYCEFMETKNFENFMK